MNKVIIALLINSSTVLAAGRSGSPLDLKWPAFNLLLLASMLI